jgi:hypothetical protein
MNLLVRFKRFILSLFAILGGLGILTVSFFRTAQIVATSQPNLEASNRRVYFGEVKPDHVLYPLVAFKEQISLSFTTREDRVKGELKLADEKLKFAEELFANGDEDLAVDTLIKSEQLLFLAAHDYTELNQSNNDLRQAVLVSLYHHQASLNKIVTSSSAHQATKINELIEQQKGVVQTLSP